MACIGCQHIEFKRINRLEGCIQEWKNLVVSQNLVNVENLVNFIIVHRIGLHILENTIGIPNREIRDKKDIELIHSGVGQTRIRRRGYLLIGIGVQCVSFDRQYGECFSNQRKCKILLVLIVSKSRG